MQSEELAEMKTDIALIKADIKQINKFFEKVEGAVDMMSELSTQVAVQHTIVQNTVDKLEDVDKMVQEHRKEDYERTKAMHKRLEDYRKSSYNDHQQLASDNQKMRDLKHAEIMKEIKASNSAMMGKLNEQATRINSLENWKYYMLGMGAVIMFLLVKVIDVSALFG